MLYYHFDFVMDNETHIISQIANRLGVTKTTEHYQDFEDAAYVLLCNLADSMDANDGRVAEDWFVPYFRTQTAEEAVIMTKWAFDAGLIRDKVGTAKAVASVITPLVDTVESVMKDNLDDAAALAYEARGPIWTERADND